LSAYNVKSPQQAVWILTLSDQITAAVFKFYGANQWTLFTMYLRWHGLPD